MGTFFLCIYGFADNELLISVLCYIIKNGDEMRAGIDIGIPAVEDRSSSSKLPDCT
jgi:hypothetical protein